MAEGKKSIRKMFAQITVNFKSTYLVGALGVQLCNAPNRFLERGREKEVAKEVDWRTDQHFYRDQLLDCYFAKNLNYCFHLTEVAEKQVCSMRLKSSPSRVAQFGNPNPKQVVLHPSSLLRDYC
jgi:hypothetical protein